MSIKNEESSDISELSKRLAQDWLEVGRVVAPQGLQGEVRIYPDSDFPERFVVPGTRWLLRPRASELEAIELLAGRFLAGKGLYVVQLDGITDRDQAEDLRDTRLFVPMSDRPVLDENEFHVTDLIGLAVYHQATQAHLGTVTDVLPAGNDLLEVELLHPDDPKHSRVLIPFVIEIVPVVDLQARRVEILPPDGLLAL